MVCFKFLDKKFLEFSKFPYVTQAMFNQSYLQIQQKSVLNKGFLIGPRTVFFTSLKKSLLNEPTKEPRRKVIVENQKRERVRMPLSLNQIVDQDRV